MALSQIKVFMHIRGEADDRTKHDAKKSLRKLSGALTLALEDADVVVFHNGSSTVLQNALGLGKPIVSPEWLNACRSAGKLLDYAGFTLVDSTTSPRMLKAVVAAATNTVVTDDTPERPAPPVKKPVSVLIDESQSQGTATSSKHTTPAVAKTSAAPPAAAKPKLAPVKASSVAAAEKPYLAAESPTTEPPPPPPAPASPSKRRVAVPAKDRVNTAASAPSPPLPPPTLAPPPVAMVAAPSAPQAEKLAKSAPKQPPTAAAPTNDTTATEVKTARRLPLVDNDSDDDAPVTLAAASTKGKARGRRTLAEATATEDQATVAKQPAKKQPPPPQAAPSTATPPDEAATKRKVGRKFAPAPAPAAAAVPGKSPKRLSATSSVAPCTVFVAFSGVEDRDTLRGIVASLGGQVVDDVFGRAAKKPTHLVVEGTTLSPKILLALCLGIPILSPQWILTSLCNGSWASLDGPEADEFYCPLFDRASHHHRVALIKDRDRSMLEDRPVRGPQFLEGVSLYFHGKSDFPGNVVFQELVQLAGGEVVRNPEATGLTAVVDMSGTAPSLQPRSNSGTAAAIKSPKKALEFDAPVIALTWIIESIVKCAALPIADFVKEQPATTTAVSRSGTTPPAVQTTSSSPAQRPSTAALATSLGRTPENAPALGGALALALKKRSPGPPSAVKAAQNQWSTQQLRESDSSSGDSDSDDDR